MSNNLICFGDVVKLSAKSAFVDGDADGSFLGFLEQKKEMLLVVAPVKDELKTSFKEAEFVVAPVRGDKPPLPGTPLNYKQPFVLKTSDGSGYSLNNKTPNMSEVVSLREMGIKGEMYVAVEKEGFGQETHVHDGDMGVELHVVDSNRIRKTYDNVPLKHFAKTKSDAPGGFVTCAQKKAQVLNFKIVKVAEKTTTNPFIKDPVFRRASQLLDPKADETSEASVLESPSRAGSIVTTGPLMPESPVVSAPSSPTAAAAAAAAAAEPKDETPETQAPAEPVATTPSVAIVAEPAVATTTSSSTATAATTSVESTPAAATTVAPSTTGVDPVALTAQLLQSVDAATVEAPLKPVDTVSTTDDAPSIVGGELQTALATVELSAASISETGNVDGSVPVHDKLAVLAHHQQPTTTTNATEAAATVTSVATELSEFETLPGLPSVPEEHVETACAGKCAIM